MWIHVAGLEQLTLAFFMYSAFWTLPNIAYMSAEVCGDF